MDAPWSHPIEASFPGGVESHVTIPVQPPSPSETAKPGAICILMLLPDMLMGHLLSSLSSTFMADQRLFQTAQNYAVTQVLLSNSHSKTSTRVQSSLHHGILKTFCPCVSLSLCISPVMHS